MPTLRSIFTAPQPTAPVQIDTTDLRDLTDEQLRARLDDAARQRRHVVAQHAARIQPLVERREKLMAELTKLDSDIAWQGIVRQDDEREIDRQVQRVQAEQHGRARPPVEGDDGVVVDDDDVVDQHAVDDLLGKLLSGKVRRNDLVPASRVEVEACELYQQAEAEAVAWCRMAAQTMRVSGRLPDHPASVERFGDDVLRDLARRQGLSL